MVDMTINDAAKYLTATNKWRRGGDAPNPVKLGVAIDTLVGFINTLKVVDADPIVGRRYFFVTVSKSRVKYEVKVIGVCAGYVVYRRKGCGAQLCGFKDFLKNFELIGGNGG
jgi:hypothetical protein